MRFVEGKPYIGCPDNTQFIAPKDFMDEIGTIANGSYRVELHQWVGAYVPTDVGSVLTKGIYEVYKEISSAKIDKLLEEALLNMMDGDVFDIYCALSTIYSQLIEESFDSAPSKIDRDKILNQLRAKWKKISLQFKYRYFNSVDIFYTIILKW